MTAHIEAVDIEEGLALILKHRFYLDDEDSSHTRMLLDAHEDRQTMASPIRAAWVARDQAGTPLGAALVCEGGDTTGGKDTVSLFVAPGARRKGVGTALLRKATARYPDLAGFHTPEAQGLYARFGMDVAFYSRQMLEEGHQAGPVRTRRPRA